MDEAGEERVDDYPLPGYAGATNQQTELLAVIEALRALATRRARVAVAPYRRVVIWTDSMYLVNGYQSARYTWPVSDWMTAEGNPVANAPLWKELVKVAHRTGKRVDIRWVKGHKHSRHNKSADKLAKRSAQQPVGPAPAIVKVRRKKSARAVETGSVKMRGQRETIRVITDEYLRVQGLNKYKYEVMSEDSEFSGRVDIAYSEAGIHLSAGHTYDVRFNDDTRRPRVVELIGEVT